MKKRISRKRRLLGVSVLVVVIAMVFVSCSSVEIETGFVEELTPREIIDNELQSLSDPFTFIDFEGVSAGPKAVGYMFAEALTQIHVSPFKWSNGITTNGGYTEVSNANMADHIGQEMFTNNVRLNFKFPGTQNKVIFFYGEYGGNINLLINGNVANPENMMDLHGTYVGGVEVLVINNSVPGGVTGVVLLRGVINELQVGGQEFFIDHLGYK